jgi:hypothetical protein
LLLKIKLKILFFFGLITFSSFGQSKNSRLIGKYYSVNNKFEKQSIMELCENGIFKYKYSLSACQGQVTGKYTVVKNRIQFKNDKEFTKEFLEKERDSLNSIFPGIEIPIIPDLSLTEWKIKNNSIKPITKINCGCFIEKGEHKRK